MFGDSFIILITAKYFLITYRILLKYFTKYEVKIANADFRGHITVMCDCTVYLPGHKGVYIRKYPPPWGGLSADVIWRKKYETGEEKKEENVKEKGEKTEYKGEIEVK
jgi:hypothetical protein